MTPFLEILYGLSHDTGLKLYPDQNEACKLVLENGIHVQLEMDPATDNLILGGIIAETPPGKFREKILKHALVANNQEFPNYGCLCYIHSTNSLALYDTLPSKNVDTEFLIDFITVFADKVQTWKRALEEGRPGPNIITSASSDNPPMFGLKS
ncbi:hypothetical protein COB11_04000 [Candidatus Aerophobetes bacterium]|uniref:Uncharacterized protein n=1 Tax=Aerophobetes bacterium TaxID=2030807 RepID=A0A2A4YJ32_UNCAE|nr:MAG: hypothetical protein COB11_04000 [Candidatus Aerophobetes bacterium]